MSAILDETEAERRALAEVAGRLQRKLGLPAEIVERAMAEAVDRYAACSFRGFVPILVEREVRERLRGHTRG